MRGLTSLTTSLALLAAASACGKDSTEPGDPVVASLKCADGSTDNNYAACTLKLTSPAGFKVQLVSSSCRAHGNLFRITAPVVDTLFVDGCYVPIGTEIVHSEPFPINTEISAEVIAPFLGNTPTLLVEGDYNQGWTLSFEDGEDEDHDDLILKLTPIPQSPNP